MDDNTDYYKIFAEAMESREKQRCALQNEILKLREKQISLLIQLQEHVQPKKMCALAEANAFQQNVLNYEKEAVSDLNNTVECDEIPSLRINFEEINSLISKADDFLKEQQDKL